MIDELLHHFLRIYNVIIIIVIRIFFGIVVFSNIICQLVLATQRVYKNVSQPHH